MKKSLGFLSLLAILFVFTATSFAEQEIVVTQGGLTYLDFKAGTGATAEPGRIVVIHFIGWLDKNGEKGEQIFSSRDRGEPVAFKLGTDRVMKGWNIGLEGMKAGGKRKLMIPHALGYGSQGVEDIVPPNTDLIFEIELIEVN